MPKRTDLKKIMVIGSGPIVIGQAAEFDYAGTQACLALREEGYEVVLCNSNPATIMTDSAIADRVYMEPLTAEYLAAIIKRERPDAVLPGIGGQTGLNLAMQLEREGVLDDKARAAVGGAFATGEGVQRRFKYLDLVDMNDGNLWVSTADQSSVTIFVPYFEGISAEDTIAVAYFDGLTRDYTLALGQADLDAEITGTTAHAVKVTKAADGIFFEVPWAEFGPFELMWIDADTGEGPGDDTGQQPGDTGQQPGGDTGNIADDQTDKPHGQLVQTGDYTLMIAGGIAVLALVAIVVGVVLARRKREQ